MFYALILGRAKQNLHCESECQLAETAQNTSRYINIIQRENSIRITDQKHKTQKSN